MSYDSICSENGPEFIENGVHFALPKQKFCFYN